MQDAIIAYQAFPLPSKDAGYTPCCSVGRPDSRIRPQSDGHPVHTFYSADSSCHGLCIACPCRPFLAGYTQSKKSTPRSTASKIFCRCTDPHQISGFILRQVAAPYYIQNVIHLLMAFHRLPDHRSHNHPNPVRGLLLRDSIRISSKVPPWSIPKSICSLLIVSGRAFNRCHLCLTAAPATASFDQPNSAYIHA